MLPFSLVLAFWILALVALAILIAQALQSRRMAKRLDMNGESVYAVAAETDPGEEPDPLRRWLYLAGFRLPYAPAMFIILSLLCAVVGFVLFGYLQTAVVHDAILGRLRAWPAGLGAAFTPLATLIPWLVLFIFPFIPAMVVRSVRRERVASIEADLPVTLEMLATLVESGLSFDSAMDRVLVSFPANRPLAQELRIFRADLQSGRPRVQCLRRLSRRIDVGAFSVCISAIVQSEQIGASVADVLRRQSDELRERRRERAMEFAMSQAIKRVFPMVITLLPGLLLAAVGPTFYETLVLIQNVVQDLRGSGFQ